MNSHREWKSPSTFYHARQEQDNALSMYTNMMTTVALLSIGYWLLNFSDAWPSTIKQKLYELIIYLIPSQAIYALQIVMARFARLSHEDLRFRRTDFGDQHAKAEALRRMLGRSALPQAIRKARSLSGIDNILPASKEIGPPGLANPNLACYQNSIMQGLASLPAFKQYIDASLKMCDNIAASATNHRALHFFLARLDDTTLPRATLWIPDTLSSMSTWQQQDAQEYYTRILDAVEKESSKYSSILVKLSTSGLEALTSDKSDEDEATSLLERVSFKDTSVTPALSTLRTHDQFSPETLRRIRSKPSVSGAYKCPFDGMLAQALECRACGFSEGYSLTRFNCLTLNLGRRSSYHLEELFEDYTNPEEVDGVECTECTKAASDKAERRQNGEGSEADCPSPSKRPKLKPVLRTKDKQITLGRLPKDLAIHINRSVFNEYGDQLKNTAAIRYPARLAISSRWCAPLREDDGIDHTVATYELKCSVTHYGRHENGHYVAFGKREKTWYCFNDELVESLDEEEVLARPNVFMLFYERIDDQPTEVDPPEKPQAVSREVAITRDARRAQIQDSTSSSSSSEGEALSPPQSDIPIPRIPVLRTASGTLKTEEKMLGTSTIVPAL